MGYISEFLDSLKYGAAQSTAENAQRDIQNMDRLLGKRSITEQTYEEEVAKKRAIYDTASENALRYAESLNASKLQRSGSPQAAPVKDSFYITPEDEARMAAAREQATAGSYSPYGMGTANFSGGQTSVGPATQVPASVVNYLQQASVGFGPKQPEMQGPPVPDYLQEGYAPPKAEATGRRWDMSGPEPVLIESPAAQAAPEPVSRGRQMAQEQEKPKTHAQIMASLPTEGDREEYKRVIIEKDKAAKLSRAIQYVTQAYPPEEQKHALEMYKEQINLPYAGEDLRRMEERPIFKQATEVFGQKYRDRVDVLANLRGQLQEAKSITDPGKRTMFLQTEIPKMLNTIAVAAPDAVGVEEGKRIMAELSTIFNTSITQWGDLVANKGFIDAVFKKPDDFLKKAGTIYNIAANVSNEKTKHYHNKLGGNALTAAGGTMLKPFTEGDSMSSLQTIRTGEPRRESPFAPAYPGDTSYGTPALNQSMSRPLKNGTISSSGVRLFGPTPSPFQQ